MRLTPWLTLGLPLLALGALLATGCQPGGGGYSSTLTVSNKPKADDFTLDIVTGGKYTLSKQGAGHPVLINFFGTT